MIKLTEEEAIEFRRLSSKRKYSFWYGWPLMSDRARFIISTPHLAEKLAEEIRKERKKLK